MHVAEVIFDQQDVSVRVHGHAANLADFCAGHVKPLAITRMNVGEPVHKYMDDTHAIGGKHILLHMPKVGPGIRECVGVFNRANTACLLQIIACD